MTEDAEGRDFPSEQNSGGPDYFGYYVREVAELLSQDKDPLPCSSSKPEFVGNTKGVVKEKDVCRNDYTGNGSIGSIVSGPPFCDAAGAGLSDITKERLRVILQQSVVILSQEVDEILDPVLNLCRIKAWIKREKSSLPRISATHEEDAEKHPRKKPKLNDHARPDSCRTTEKVDEDMQILLEPNGEDLIAKHANDFSNSLHLMERKLEGLLDIVMSSCRPMTHVEKHQLCRLIKNLPPQNLNRVAEILRPQNPLDDKCLENIDVNLEHEDNTTLWRLYYYVQTFENAKKLQQKR